MSTSRTRQDLLDLDSALAVLKTSRPTLYRWLRTGQLTGVKVGRKWRFRREDLDRMLRGEGPRIELPAGVASLAGALGLPDPARADAARLAQIARALVDRAIARGATDVHLAPRRDLVDVRYRVAGLLETELSFDHALLSPIVDQFKVLARRDLHDRARPQEARIDAWPSADARLDLRLCFLPTALGESLTIRIRDPRNTRHALAELFSPADLERLGRPVSAGLVLITGPSGSGKTTTLYSYLAERAASTARVMTIEDPVEYLLEGCEQVAVDRAAGLTPSVALRAVLSADADAIVLTDPHDPETLSLALEAATTGHLVILQLHVDEAAAAPERLIELGADRTLVADALRLVTCQRLVRALCPACRRPATPPPSDSARALELARAGGLAWKRLPRGFHEPAGCADCHGTGFRGRIMIAETLTSASPVAHAIRKNAPVDSVRNAALEDGMTTLAADGLRRAALGATSIAEVLRVCR